MTDNEIIKFIEHAINSAKGEDGFKEIYWEKLYYSLDLINRQKAEIENLKDELKAMRGTANSYKLDNERLLQKLQQAKSEALMHAFSKFAGHSDYHGDTILCQLACMAEGKETKSAIPIDMNQIKSEAIKELWNKLQDYIFRDDFSVDGRLILDADEVKEVIQRELDK